MPLYARFDCSFPADPKVIEAGDRAELLYFRSVLYCREHLTDGLIDRRALKRVAFGISGRSETHAERLVTVGLWVADVHGWRIPLHAWSRWNPTRSEVESARQAEADRKASWRDKRRTGAGRDANATDVSRWDATSRDADATDSHSQSHSQSQSQSQSQRKPLASAPPNAAAAPKLNGTPRAAVTPEAPDELWDALMAACGITGPPTASARGAYNRALADLRSVDATPDEVAARAVAYRSRFPDAALTPSALSRHWAELNGHVKVNTAGAPPAPAARPQPPLYVATHEPVDYARARAGLRMARGDK